MPLNSRSIWITFDTPQEIPPEFHKSKECAEGFARILEVEPERLMQSRKCSVLGVQFDEVHIKGDKVVVMNSKGERRLDLSTITRIRIS